MKTAGFLQDDKKLAWIVTGAALALSLLLKGWLIVGGFLPFNADEAVVALMGRHILQGARPVFFYGQAYQGSLDAWLAAAGFAVFGEQVWVIRLVQSVLYLGTLATTAWLGKVIFRRWVVGALAALLLAIPTVNVTLYTSVSLGGYGEALLLGNLILLCAFGMTRRDTHAARAGLWLVWGFLSGLGVWAFGLTLIYTIASGLYILAWLGRSRGEVGRRAPAWVGLALVGALLGAAPLWGFARQHGLALLLQELGGGAIAGVEGAPYLARVGQHTLNLLLLGSTAIFGLRPPWGVEWLALPLLPLVLAFWLATLAHAARSLRRPGPQRAEKWALAGVGLVLLAVFVLTPFGADPSGRYFVPLAIPLALFAADGVLGLRPRFGRWVYLAPALILAANLWGTLQSAAAFPPGLTTQFYAPTRIDHRYDAELIEFLSAQGETRGYTTYWVAYPLAFLSQEALIFTPRLPYHLDFRYTPRDDRYAPYRQLVTEAARTAYITARHPRLDEHLRARFTALGIMWQEAAIGDYRVFYRLSRPVQPDELQIAPLSAAGRGE